MEKPERADRIFGWTVAVIVGFFYLLFSWALPRTLVNQLNQRWSLGTGLPRNSRESRHKNR